MNRWKRMYYLDANVFIFPHIYDLRIESAVKAQEYLIALVEEEIEGCTSTLTWDEIAYVVRKFGGIEENLNLNRNL